jgi:hypothetical protein
LFDKKKRVKNSRDTVPLSTRAFIFILFGSIISYCMFMLTEGYLYWLVSRASILYILLLHNQYKGLTNNFKRIVFLIRCKNERHYSKTVMGSHPWKPLSSWFGYLNGFETSIFGYSNQGLDEVDLWIKEFKDLVSLSLWTGHNGNWQSTTLCWLSTSLFVRQKIINCLSRSVSRFFNTTNLK